MDQRVFFFFPPLCVAMNRKFEAFLTNYVDCSCRMLRCDPRGGSGPSTQPNPQYSQQEDPSHPAHPPATDTGTLGSAAGTSTYRACVSYGYNWYKYIGRGQLLQVQRPVSAAGTDSLGKAPGESTKCTVSFTGIGQLQVQEQKAGVIFSLSTWSGVSCRYRYIGKGQLKAQVQGKG
jgi:hypothetical protein